MRVRFGDCVFDAEARELWRGERRVPLSPKAFLLLRLLLQRRPRPLAQAELRDALWPDSSVGYTSLARVVNEVRNAIGDDAGRATLLRTVPRFGYAFGSDAVEQAPQQPARFLLVAEDREYPLHEGETLVGRGPECGVRLLASRVSRVHARVKVQAARPEIEDCGSKNGTWVNGSRIEGAVALGEGDEVFVGNERLLFRCVASLETTRTATPR
jgi:DNA-binding winged helix-turn-helix (wHTH) protein